jgi:hypothetical protein
MARTKTVTKNISIGHMKILEQSPFLTFSYFGVKFETHGTPSEIDEENIGFEMSTPILC